MASYYVNRQAQPTGEHEVHRGSCDYLPNIKVLYYLGDFDTPEEAVLEAEKYYIRVVGCSYCC